MPVTPPESPAIFHFSLPSPGLESPLEVFENLSNDLGVPEVPPRIEQVDFRLPSQKLAEAARISRRQAERGRPAHPLPSLEQISQRLTRSPSSVRINRSPSPDQESSRTNRLPSFLRSRPASPEVLPAEKAPRPKLTLPVLNPSLFIENKEPTLIVPRAVLPFPPSPKSPLPPKLQITTTLCPPTRSKGSPTEFTEANVEQFGSTHKAEVLPKPAQDSVRAVPDAVPARRAEAAKDMFNKLSRRTPCLAGAAACGIQAKDDIIITPPTDDKLKRRTSAPAELPASARKVHHPVLERPGGF